MNEQQSPANGEPGTYTLPAGYRWRGRVHVFFRHGDWLQLEFDAQGSDNGRTFRVKDRLPMHIEEWRRIWNSVK